MNKSAIFLLLLASCTAQLLMAQQPGPAIDRPAEPNFAFDDDGGKVQTVPKLELGAASAVTKKYHGGAVMKSVQQVSVFLGEGWGNGEARSREATLSDLPANNDALASALESRKIQAAHAAPTVDDFAALGSVNDLDIQRKLVEMLQSKAIPAPGASTIYVIYLAPGMNSTLGGLKGGIDYAAYHNIVHVEAGELRYVVVPFDADAAAHRAAASRAYGEASENPHVIDGWF